MRKVAIWGIVAVCLTVLLAGSGPAAQRVRLIEAAALRPATQVEVTNLPAVQAVSGAVNVANLPAVQAVSGSVQVNNLPLDAAGNLRVAGGLALQEPRTKRFIGITQATVEPITLPFGPHMYATLAMNRACQVEFPGTTVCLGRELASSAPAPPAWAGFVLSVGGDHLDVTFFTGGCLDAPGVPLSESTDCTGPQPVACCGF